MEDLREPTPPQSVTLSHAAALLGRERKLVDTMVRRAMVVPRYGKGGHGGEYRLDRDALVILQTAMRLEELHVPRSAIKRLAELLQSHLGEDAEVAVIYAPESEEVVVVREESVLREVLRGGATVELVHPKRQREELERRLQEEESPRRRGRPRLGHAWVQKKLDATAQLGDEHASPQRIAELLGDRGKRPWQKS